MNFETAMTTVKSGTTVKRSAWKNRAISKVTDSAGNEQIINTEVRTIKAPYLATQEDIFATDWTT